MISIQSSSYGVSALVSSQMPAATKNAETSAQANKVSAGKEIGAAEGTQPSGGPPSGNPPPVGPPPGAEKAATSTDDPDTAPALLETDDTEEPDAADQTSWDDFQAATQYLEEIIDLREEDNTDGPASNDSGVSFDEAGTYRPAWIK